ncbi:metallopeptidase family protein [Pseudaestuariivita atlantica]|uniref:Neutral zinc metallopeptidase n=1 Tax=Pseudaestuariivita atlantica TaxID=1317121 RepID=A0A0L1JS71_9RHOB|nr:metallopeptidase family protein [Pseudaestuariivita atlantica]KNG94253.1 neutral zinc metallopeptidase [Pseudaestuariivita atlantica]
MTTADPTLDDIEAIARKTLAALPAPFVAGAAEVHLAVVDWPPQDVLDELDIDDPLDLTGLYDGIPLTRKSVLDQPVQPDTIWLFREPILDELAERGNVTLEELVAHVTLHELAHHFGWSDDDIAMIDRWWE